ncbi:MAG: hypothetical protein II499_01265 [Firmicutes bacterium]|nr:hypothetical protein [Bacillota bacterium]MBQ5436785.1 hypothetical protein [Bacillota bacterium]
MFFHQDLKYENGIAKDLEGSALTAFDAFGTEVVREDQGTSPGPSEKAYFRAFQR